MTLDLTQTQAVIALILSGIALVTTLWERFTSGSRANGKRIAEIEERQSQLERSLQSLGQTVAAMPGKDELHEVRLTLVEMAGKMDVISAHIGGQKDVMKRLETIVSRHEDHLLSGGKT